MENVKKHLFCIVCYMECIYKREITFKIIL